MAGIILNLHNATSIKCIPTQENFQTWVELALRTSMDTEVSIRLTDIDEMSKLNETYRKKSGPTNVLAFPDENDLGDDDYLGDIAICAPVVNQEAIDQAKEPMHHWAHMTIHAMLHLQGFDHINEKQADTMEALETQLLSTINIPNPYAAI